MFMTAMQ